MKILDVVPYRVRSRVEEAAESRFPGVTAAAKEAMETYEVAARVPADYGAFTALLGTVQVAGVTFLVTGLLTPIGFLAALVLVPLWPWVFVLPALLLAISLASAAVAAYLLTKVVPRRLRLLGESLRAAGEHAVDRYQQYRESRANGNGHGTVADRDQTVSV